MLAPTEGLQGGLYREMLGRIKETDLSVPVRRDGYWYYTRTEEGSSMRFIVVLSRRRYRRTRKRS